MIKEITLDEILGIKDLEKREYLVEPHRRGNNFNAGALIKFRASWEDIIYVGSQRLGIKLSSLDYIYSENSREIHFDSMGFPYFEKKIDNLRFPIYKEIFLGNTDLGSGLANLNRTLLLNIYNYVRKNKHFIYEKFSNYLKDFKYKVPKIEENCILKRYFYSSDDTSKISRIDKVFFRIFEGDKLLNNSRAREDAFIEWYRDFLICNSYEKKIEEASYEYRQKIDSFYHKENQHFLKSLSDLEDKLKIYGFRKVEKLSFKEK
ncbi:hypothetical protein J4471_03295 [Candidatus Woesearchaeota archaeon]|nr:hypothetical protein [Candidatus Woesearchaeota archaeon]